MIDKLREVSNRRMELTNHTFVRDIYSSIEWSSRCILLNGCRGVGKTYLMFQYLKTNKDTAIYFSLDNLFFLTNSISETVAYYYNLGFRYFGMDEIHKYKTWSIEIKNIYDNFFS
jgi:predicted AAA+ superfamily ATPase